MNTDECPHNDAVCSVSPTYGFSDRMVFLMIVKLSFSWSSLMISGGANRMISPCVGFANKPFSLSFRHMSNASNSIKTLELDEIIHRIGALEL